MAIYNDLISVIVPVYNAEAYLERCIGSICRQDYKNLEIIIINDGSRDKSGSICTALAKRDKRIKVFHQQNAGQAEARNQGICCSHGRWLMFVDSDDYLTRDCVGYLLHEAVENHADIAIGNYVQVPEQKRQRQEGTGNKVRICNNRQAVGQIFTRNCVRMVTPWAKLFREYLWSDIRSPQGVLQEDEATLYKIYYKSKKTVISDKVVYAYYFNESGISKNPKPKDYSDLCRVLTEQIDFFEKHRESYLADRVRNRWSIQMAAHFFPLNYYGRWREMIAFNYRLHRDIVHAFELPAGERVKGWACTWLTFPTGLFLYLKKYGASLVRSGYKIVKERR